MEPGVLEPLEYEGFVRFQRGLTLTREESNLSASFTRTVVAFGRSRALPVRQLLPDIVPTKPRNFHIESGAGAQYYFYMDRGLRHQPSCYPWETVGLTPDEPAPAVGPTKCLRWDQGEYNFGDGPFELHIYDGSSDVYQRIYSTDGSVRQIGPLGTTTFSESHGHFHYVGWQEIRLHRLRTDGTPGARVRTGLDKGICMVDIENERFGRTDVPNGPLGYPVIGTCDAATHSDPNDPTFPGRSFFQMGISVGYADLYPWYIADQYVDVTGLADGDYALVVRQDVRGRISEKNRRNNTATGCVRIAGDVATDIPCRR